MIREVHVYGPSLPLKEESEGEAQHIGLGARLIVQAKQMAREAGYTHLAVISAIGTREYYARHGFVLDGLYMTHSFSGNLGDDARPYQGKAVQQALAETKR